MSKVQKLVLTMVLVMTGLLAGLQMLMLMGVLPAMMRMPLATYAGMWQSLDHFMAVRMAIFANGTLLLYLIAIGCFVRSPRKNIFWSLLGCFALLATDTLFTVTQQLPINRAVQALDLVHLTDLSRVQQLRDATIQHFHVARLARNCRACLARFCCNLLVSRIAIRFSEGSTIMIRLGSALMLLTLCTSNVPAQNAEATSRDDAAMKEQIIAQVNTFMHAWEKRDAVALAATMAPKFLYVSSQRVAPKEGVVGALTHACTLTSYTLSDVRVVRI
jgi:hypothetical protein